MRIGLVVIVCLLVNIQYLSAQNLVPNPSFENYIECPDQQGQMFSPYVQHWADPTGTTSDYFNVCATPNYWIGVPASVFGYQFPRTGDAYAGIILWGDSFGLDFPVMSFPHPREYVEVQLTEVLQADTLYCVEFYVSKPGGWPKMATSSIGAHFSIDSISGSPTDTLNYIPQVVNSPTNLLLDTVNWMGISGQFTAQGGEKFLTIGNFYPNELSVVSYDTVVEHPGNFAYYFIDDVTVSKCSTFGTSVNALVQTNQPLRVHPNPASSNITVTRSSNTNAALQIVDAVGRVVKTLATNSHHLSAAAEPVVDVSALANGLYVLKLLNSTNGFSSHVKFVVQH